MKKSKTSLFDILTYKSRVYGRMLTTGQRGLPDFLIIGTAKGGTTSLFNYLIQHPQIQSPLKKEIHFFDAHFHKGIPWYKLHFPTKLKLNNEGIRSITGEATPYYLSYPFAPERIKFLLPEVKLIVLLRNPVDRAFSNYQHMVRLGFENESFEKALELEEERVNSEIEKIKGNKHYYSFKHQHYSYTGRGKYVEELERWFSHFPKEQFLIIDSESFYANPAESYSSVLSFLKLDKILPSNFTKFNAGDQNKIMNLETRERLDAYFKPYNEKLFQLTGIRYNL